MPGALHRVASCFHSSRNPTLIAGGYLIRGETPGVDLPAHPIAPAFAWEIYAGGRHLPSHATFWSATIHQPIDESLRFIMDADLFKRLARDGAQPSFIDEPLAVFRIHPDSKTSTIISVAQQETTAWLARAPRRIAWLWRAHLILDFVRRVRARLFG